MQFAELVRSRKVEILAYVFFMWHKGASAVPARAAKDLPCVEFRG